jgi:hypothetical protein
MMMMIKEVNVNNHPNPFFHIFLHLVASKIITAKGITLQYTTIHYNTLQYTAIHYNTLQYTTLQYTTIQYCTT